MTDTHDEWRKLNPVPLNPKRAAVYARAATVSQPGGSSSIAEKKRAVHHLCRENGWLIVAEYVDAPASGTDENRPNFQRMVNDALRGVPAFELIVVHDHSRFFRDICLAEMYRRRLLKAGVEVVSIQDSRDGQNADPVRQFIRLIHEYLSKENAKHTSRGMEENARQGFVNGSPPFGYRAVVAETRLGKAKKRLEIEPSEAEIVKLIFRLAMVGPTGNGPAGARAIARELNRQNLKTRSGQPFSSGMVNQILHRPTYMGHHIFNLIVISVPAIIDTATFEAVQAVRCGRNPFRRKISSQPGERDSAQNLNRQSGHKR
jgi:DNA invertase Pin-like site-specific DNA recombinase